MNEKKQLHLISNGKKSIKEFCEIATEIQEYVTLFHIREKTWTAKEICKAIELLQTGNVPLSKVIINDRVDVAVTMKAAGVQLAFHSLTPKVVKGSFESLLVGCSVHSVEELNDVQEAGADFVLYGHIFETNSKPGIPARGTMGLRQITMKASLPVIAIGGITPSNVGTVIEAGANGIAVMSGILEAKDPLKTANEYYSSL